MGKEKSVVTQGKMNIGNISTLVVMSISLFIAKSDKKIIYGKLWRDWDLESGRSGLTLSHEEKHCGIGQVINSVNFTNCNKSSYLQGCCKKM